MPYCPRCKEDFEGDLTSCPKCGYDFDAEENGIEKQGWVMIGKIMDKTSSDYAVETLKSYEIPAAVISESGFFGQAGLNLPSLTGKGLGQFRVYVPEDKREEAESILDMILGGNWEKAD